MKPIFKRGELDSLITHMEDTKKQQEKIIDLQFKRIDSVKKKNPYLKSLATEISEMKQQRENKKESQIQHLEMTRDIANRFNHCLCHYY